ncbi:class I adenylate-forming enzyme family protein [soil metagenome]
MINVRDAMRRSAQWHKNQRAIVSEGRELTFGEAWTRGARLANAFSSLGLKPQDRIAVLEENCIAAADFVLGCTIGNYVRVPLYKKNAPEAHAHMIRNTGAKALVIDRKFLYEIEGLSRLVPELEHIIIRDDGYESWLSSFVDTDPNPEIGIDDWYIIRHSGGTTGLPKGMGMTHARWMAMNRDWTYRMPVIESGDACIHVAPISHGSGFFFVPIWIQGAYNVLEPGFNAQRALDLFTEHGGFMFAVPTIVSDLLANAKVTAGGYPKVKCILVGGSPMLPQTAHRAYEAFGNAMFQMYGQTEATPLAWMSAKEWMEKCEGSEPLLAAGKIMPWARVEVRGADNQTLPDGEIGEIAVQVDGQITEIWQQPELSSERIIDGWVLTGDVGRIDQNGYLYLSDRKDDLIISGGMNIWPAELEMVIGDLPQVREVIVVRAPHERFGETPAAVVVLHEGQTLDAQVVIDACANRLGKLKRPTIVKMQTEPLPRTPVGKIRRNQVRDGFWQGTGSVLRGS